MKIFKNRIANIFCLFILLVALLSNNSYAMDLNSLNKNDNLEVKKTIEAFFTSYEACFDQGIYSTDIYDEYFVNGASADTSANVAIIDAMLYRKILITNECPSDLRELNKKLEFNYSKIIGSLTSASVEVTVTKTFNYSSYPDIESATRDTYLIQLQKENTGWKIVEIANFVDDIMKIQLECDGVNIDDISSIQNYKNDIKNNVQDYFTEMKSISPSTESTILSTSSTTYDGGEAANYAYDHALDYNDAYQDFSNSGGDCTNFVSQCMHEGGGLPEHTGTAYSNTCWYYTTKDNRSSSWTGVDELYDYIFGSTSTINATLSDWNNVNMGDIIQLVGSSGSGYHSLIVSGIVNSSYGRSDILICAHSEDRRHVSLTVYYPSATKRYIDILGSDL